MIAAHYSTSLEHEATVLPFLHTVLQSPNLPLALVERALRRFANQASLPDTQGNLPLHFVARRFPDEEMDFLDKVLTTYPVAAQTKNKVGQLPFHLAVQAQRRFDSGIESLLTVDPGPLADVELSQGVLPLVLADWFSRGRTRFAYVLIKSNPEMFGE